MRTMILAAILVLVGCGGEPMLMGDASVRLDDGDVLSVPDCSGAGPVCPGDRFIACDYARPEPGEEQPYTIGECVEGMAVCMYDVHRMPGAPRCRERTE